MCEWPRLEELEHLHSALSLEERDELLQRLLVAAPRGGEAMIKMLENLLLCQATEELIEGQCEVQEAEDGPHKG